MVLSHTNPPKNENVLPTIYCFLNLPCSVSAVNHHSPLFRPNDVSEFDFRAQLNIDATVKFYLGAGASRDKLVLGIPTYGRSYNLVNPLAHEIGSPTEGPGDKGEGTKEDGYLAYYEVSGLVINQDEELLT